MKSSRRRIKKSTVVNKTRFTIFCVLSLSLLSLIFIKVFMPALNSTLSANNSPSPGQANSGALIDKETEDSEEVKDLTEKPEPTESREKAQVNTETEDPSVKLPGKQSEILKSNQGDYIYFRQTDPLWATKTFGPEDPIGTHGCGPTVMASIVSSLTGSIIDPVEMSNWAYEHGYLAPDAGSYHSLIPQAAEAYGLKTEPMYYPSVDQLEEALRDEKYVVMCSGHGTFSSADGHFIVLIDTDDMGKVKISDSLRYKHVGMDWNIEDILAEASPVSSSGGPFWAIWK